MTTDIDALGLVEGIAQIIPQYARRILHAGCGSGALARALKARSQPEVHGIARDEAAANDARMVMDSVLTVGLPQTALPFAPAHFEGIIFEASSLDEQRLEQALRQLVPLLAPEGFLVIVMLDEPAAPPRTAPQVGTVVDRAGLAVYTFNDITQQSPDVPAADGRMGNRGFLLWAVWPAYNPITHARSLFNAGHPGWAYEVLDLVPDLLVQGPEVRAAYYSERHLCLLAWDKLASEEGRLGRFFNGQSMFYEAVWNAPTAPMAYLCQAEFWRRLGNDNMCARLLRTIRHVTPLPEIERRLASCGRAEHLHPGIEVAPQWRASDRRRRILFIITGRPHYGLDVLYDGLCSVLGDENVVDFPWKSTLHGEVPRELANYPCAFNRRGRALHLDELLAQLRAGAFDLILMGDVEQCVGIEAARAILDAAPSLPLFVVDEQDDPLNNLPDTLAFLGRESIDGYFKREMLACVDYGAVTRPLPFAYADHKVPKTLPKERGQPLFWAGHRKFGLRRLYLERVEQILGISYDRKYSQEEYVAALQASRIGLNIFGFGYDTVRYWEVPAHGCMLLSERVPIRIPHNFQDGESAVFFDDLPDLEKKLAYYVERPEETRRIAERGHEVFKRHHTASARAKQMLAYADEFLAGR